MGHKRLLHTHQRITLRIVAGVGGDAEYAGLCGFYAVGYLHYGAIDAEEAARSVLRGGRESLP